VGPRAGLDTEAREKIHSPQPGPYGVSIWYSLGENKNNMENFQWKKMADNPVNIRSEAFVVIPK
jgi:hypothetical protein